MVWFPTILLCVLHLLDLHTIFKGLWFLNQFLNCAFGHTWYEEIFEDEELCRHRARMRKTMQTFLKQFKYYHYSPTYLCRLLKYRLSHEVTDGRTSVVVKCQ